MPDSLVTTPEDQLHFIQKVISATGPRLPGSEEEKRAAEMVAEEFERVTGQPATTETFEHHPMASIAMIPALGYLMLLVATPLYFLAPSLALVASATIMTFAFIQIFRYLGWFDFLFPKRISRNVYSVIEPESGQVDCTLVLGSHIDSSWHCPGFLAGNAAIKLGYGVASAVAFMVLSLLRVLQEQNVIFWAGDWSLVVIFALVPGFWFIARFMTWRKLVASPGAADNLSGVASGLFAASHYRNHPEQAPANCRLVLAAFGAEEAGLKGSTAFVRRHREDLLNGEVWVLNVDTISDFDHFHVIDGDTWLGTRYDNDFCRLAEQAMQAAGVKYMRMRNPVGGSDSAPFSKAGIRTTLLNAQDPTPSDRYHTFKDITGSIDPRALEKNNEVILKLIEAVDRQVHDR
jgi:aminopeptidase YwaD